MFDLDLLVSDYETVWLNEITICNAKSRYTGKGGDNEYWFVRWLSDLLMTSALQVVNALENIRPNVHRLVFRYLRGARLRLGTTASYGRR